MSGERSAPSLDRRTRLHRDLARIVASDFFAREVPARFQQHGTMLAAAMDRLKAPPLAIGRSFAPDHAPAAIAHSVRHRMEAATAQDNDTTSEG